MSGKLSKEMEITRILLHNKKKESGLSKEEQNTFNRLQITFETELEDFNQVVKGVSA